RGGVERGANGGAPPHRGRIDRRSASSGGSTGFRVLTQLVLASASPRRQALVALLGGAWRVAPAGVAREDYPLSQAAGAGADIAVAKAAAVTGANQEIVVAADTLVVVGDDILGKPADARAAGEMLDRLRGRGHHVLTGVAVRSAMLSWAGVVDTRVLMRD